MTTPGIACSRFLLIGLAALCLAALSSRYCPCPDSKLALDEHSLRPEGRIWAPYVRRRSHLVVDMLLAGSVRSPRRRTLSRSVSRSRSPVRRDDSRSRCGLQPGRVTQA